MNHSHGWNQTVSLLTYSRKLAVDVLYDAITQNHIEEVALDVFSTELYDGKLIKLDNIILTVHMGFWSKVKIS